MNKLTYFPVRVRAEAIRMLYAVARVEFEDVRVAKEDFLNLKSELPLGQVPIMETPEGILCQSNTIARYVAKKHGLAGSCLWEETLHDLVIESVQEGRVPYGGPTGILSWQVRKASPVPENKDEILKNAGDRVMMIVKYIQSIAEKRGKKYIVGDELGVAELWLYSMLEFWEAVTPGSMTMTPWIKEFTEKVAADPKLAKYLAERPDSPY